MSSTITNAPAPAPVAPPVRRTDRRRPGHIDLDDLPVPLDGSIRVRAWPDEYLSVHGHHIRSSYVELFWLGVLGPTATVLLRRLAGGLDHSPDGFRLPVADTARSIGLGRPTTRHSPFVRALHRCVIYRVARFVDADLEVRLRLPTLNNSQLRRLPESLQAAHRLIGHRPAVTTVPAVGATRDSSGSPSGGSTGQ